MKWLQSRLKNLGDITSYSTIPPRGLAFCCWHHNLIPKAWWDTPSHGSTSSHTVQESDLHPSLAFYSGIQVTYLLLQFCPMGQVVPQNWSAELWQNSHNKALWLVSSLPCTCPFCACSYKKPPAGKKTSHCLLLDDVVPSHHQTQVAYSSLTSPDKWIADLLDSHHLLFFIQA